MNIVGHSAPPHSPAVKEAIQHHIDRLASNQTKSEYVAVGHGVARSIQPHSSGPGVTPFLRNIVQHSPLKNFTSNVHSTGRDIATSFNPTTKSGIANLAGMFVPGRLGGIGKMPEYDLALHYPVGEAIAPKDTTGRPIAMRVLTNRAQGAGRYNRPQGGLAEIARIEALRQARAKIGRTNDMIKDYANDTGLRNKQSRTQMFMNHTYSDKTGGALEQYPENQGTPPNMDRQPGDYKDRLTLLNLAQRNPMNDLLPGAAGQAALKQVLHDLLFGNFKGPKPPFPRP